jgi:hypothetical protein
MTSFQKTPEDFCAEYGIRPVMSSDEDFLDYDLKERPSWHCDVNTITWRSKLPGIKLGVVNIDVRTGDW